LRTVLIGKLQEPLSARRVTVADNDMGMGVVGILPRVVDRRQPRHAVGRQAADKNPNQGFPLCCVHLQRQGHHDLVDHPRILPVGLLGFIEPSAGLRGSCRHVLANDHASSSAAGDVSHMRACRPCAVRAAPDSAMAQAENRHART